MGVYTAKVTGRVVPIRIDATNDEGGWDGTNLATGKAVRIPTPRRLRREVTRAELKSGKAPGIDRKPLHGAKAGVKRPSKTKTKTNEAKSMSALDAAQQVLLESTEPLGAKEIVRLAAEAGVLALRRQDASRDSLCRHSSRDPREGDRCPIYQGRTGQVPRDRRPVGQGRQSTQLGCTIATRANVVRPTRPLSPLLGRTIGTRHRCPIVRPRRSPPGRRSTLSSRAS